MSPKEMEGIKQLIELLNNALPGTWDILVRQSYIYGIGLLILGAIIGIISFLLIRKFNNPTPDEVDKAKNSDKEDEIEGAIAVGTYGTAFLALLLLIIGSLYLLNPGYYAIQMLKP